MLLRQLAKKANGGCEPFHFKMTLQGWYIGCKQSKLFVIFWHNSSSKNVTFCMKVKSCSFLIQSAPGLKNTHVNIHNVISGAILAVNLGH